MPLKQLTDAQIRSWSRVEKDRWWFEHVYRGDMPQLTWRSAVTGFLVGGILSATALYIGAKTGISIGVGLTSVIVAFALYRLLAQVGVAKDFTILENNCTQSIATAAGYMITPLIASLGSYMLVTGRIVPWWQMLIWVVVIAILGVLVAFPMKRRFINEDQLPFPEGRACGVVLDALYTGRAEAGMFKARLLGVTTLLTGTYQFLASDGFMKLVQFKVLRMDQWAGMKAPWYLMERLDSYYYGLAAQYHLAIPKILGTDIRQLGLRATLDAAMLGIGGLMGIRVATSCALGAFINFAVLAPMLIRAGEIKPYLAPDGTLVPISRGEIVNQWGLWWGVTIMVAGSLVGLFGKPEIFVNALKSVRRRRQPPAAREDCLRSIELPLSVSFAGVPLLSALAVWLAHAFFGVSWVLAAVSFPLIFVLSVICTNSMALTSWTPTGPLAKITQFSIGALDRSNPASNLIPAGITAEVANNAANLLSDIKPGYMLGAKPRQQAIGHIIGVFSGSLVCIPLFFLLFLPPGPDGVRTVSTMVSDRFAMPAAVQWKGVADLIAKGVSNLPPSAVISMVLAAISGVVIEVLQLRSKGRFPLSAVAIGLGVVLPPEASFAMWVGAMMFWWKGRVHREPGTRGHALWVEGYEPICAGLISGAALVGIGNAIVNVWIG